MVTIRAFATSLLVAAALAGSIFAQEKPATRPSPPSTGSFAKDIQGLTADDFQERQAAVKHIQQLLAVQIQQRAQIQDLLLALQRELAQQQRALAMVPDEEAAAQISGLLELERGLAGWTSQTMAEPTPRRTALLNWGLSKEIVPIIAKLYSTNKRNRIEGIKSLAKLPTDPANEAQGVGANWTLSRLINDPDPAVRAASMAACWSRTPDADTVGALWFRALSGPQAYSELHNGMPDRGNPENMLRVDFPDGEPLTFSPTEDDSGEFTDSQLAGAVLVHIASPLVAERMKTLLAERVKSGKNLCLSDDPDWTLVTHRLVEAYTLKEAIPVLAEEALSATNDQMGGDMAGRSFSWSPRTMAIGTLCTLIKQDPGQFNLFRARDSGETRGWIWATDMNPNQPLMQDGDGPVVRPFFTWWKAHHADYGITAEPSGASVPPEPPPRPARGRGARGRIIDPPTVAPEPVPGPVPGPATQLPAQPPASRPAPPTTPEGGK